MCVCWVGGRGGADRDTHTHTHTTAAQQAKKKDKKVRERHFGTEKKKVRAQALNGDVPAARTHKPNACKEAAGTESESL